MPPTISREISIAHNLIVCNGYLVTETPRLDQQLCFALHTATRAMNATYRPVLEELGVTYPQYLVLLALWERDGRGVGDLCEQLQLDTGTLSPLLKRLETLGLVERHRLATDERRVEIRLTTAGNDLRGAACDIPRHIAGAAQLGLAEMEALRDALVRLTHSLNNTTGKKES